MDQKQGQYCIDFDPSQKSPNYKYDTKVFCNPALAA